MRILHVYSGNLFGGVEAILVALARGRSIGPALEHQFALSFHGRLERKLVESGAAVHHVGAVRMSRPGTVRSARAALARMLEASTFERVICHAPWSQAIFGGVARRAHVPLVFWAHDVMTGRHWTERLARRVLPALVVCNSHFTKSTLPALYPGLPAEVVYAPVEPAGVRAAACSRRWTRAALDTPASATVVVQASRSERWKGHEDLLDALSTLRDLPDWVWWQVGGAQRPAEATFLDALKRSARRLGILDRIRWLGERDDVPALLDAADVYCQPNREPEPFGIALVEALAAGLPVVTSRLGGACEIVDATFGVLVEPSDPAGLASALRELIASPERRARLGERGPDRARALCDPGVALHRLAGVLREMVPAELTA